LSGIRRDASATSQNGHVDKKAAQKGLGLYDDEAEAAAIAAALRSPFVLDHASATLGSDGAAFYFKRNRAIFVAALAVVERSELPDVVTLCHELSQRGELDDVGGRERIDELIRRVTPEGQAQHYVKIVRDLADRRHVKTLGTEITKLASNQGVAVSDLVDEMKRLVSVRAERMAQPVPARLDDLPEVNLAEALEEVVGMVRKYVVLTSAQAWAVALWIVHTHAFEAATTTPYLSVTSAEMRCGKSRVLDVLAVLAANPWQVVSPTEAVLFRMIERDQPTLLLDEVDAIFGAKAAAATDGLRAILNAGYRKGTSVPRCVGEAMNLVDFAVFCPKAFAGIGNLPHTVADRCLPIRLQRAKPGERVANFRPEAAELEATSLRERLSTWATVNVAALRDAHPDLPADMNDRAADGFEPLLAIAEAAGGDWPTRAWQAASELYTGDESATRGTELLAAIFAIFEQRSVSRISSEDLRSELISDVESPWHEWRQGKPLSAANLSNLLKPFGIKSKTVRFDAATTAKGFERAQFDDAFLRYLPTGSENGLKSVTAVTTRITTGFSEEFEKSQTAIVTAGERANSSQEAVCDFSEIAANPHECSDVTAVTAKGRLTDQGETVSMPSDTEERFLQEVDAAVEAGILTELESFTSSGEEAA
jgi:hypothetical protein